MNTVHEHTCECHLANLVVIAYCDWAAGMETGATQGATRNTANRTLPGKGGQLILLHFPMVFEGFQLTVPNRS